MKTYRAAVLLTITLALAVHAGAAQAQSVEDQQVHYQMCMGSSNLSPAEPDANSTDQKHYIDALIVNARCNCAWTKVGKALTGYAYVVQAAELGEMNDDARERALAKASVDGYNSCVDEGTATPNKLAWIVKYRGNWSLNFLYQAGILKR